MEKQYAYSDGINWIHYVEYEIISDCEVKIHRIYRLHKYDDNNHPETKTQFSILENSLTKEIEFLQLKDYTVEGISIVYKNKREFIVVNPLSIRG